MPDSPIAVVTCGPAHEPIDSVRRITNFSSGELGALLCVELQKAGFAVRCFRGEMATYPLDGTVPMQAFSTNESLGALFRDLARPPAVIFHAAALCDYLLAGVGGVSVTQKIRSDAPELQLTLRPAPKLLPELPRWFPEALVIGWKYELDGTRADALARGQAQIERAGTTACVVNGAAYGPGFGLLKKGETQPAHYADKKALTSALATWTRNHCLYR